MKNLFFSILLFLAFIAVSAQPGSADFIPCEKIVAMEDFSFDVIGNFPDRWSTNATGEIAKIEGREGNWLKPLKNGVFMPEFITNLPENFTLEFDVACSADFSYYSSFLSFAFAAMANPAKEFVNWKDLNTAGRTGIITGIHPKNASGNSGMTNVLVFDNGIEMIKKEANQKQLFSGNKLLVHISIWRQNQRLRLYYNEEKVWDLPLAFDTRLKYNRMLFQTGSFWSEGDSYYISNMLLAVGAPDTRNKFLTEGRFITHGILFNPNSDTIRPESNAAIKEIAAVLNENADTRVKITVHTENDGDAASSLALSIHRAVAIKNYLSTVFNIGASRMETDGKGDTQPLEKNTTLEGKANNRRVEFIKM